MSPLVLLFCLGLQLFIYLFSLLQHFLSSLSTEDKSHVVFCLLLFPGQACLKADGMKSRSLQSYTWCQSTSAEGSVSPRPVSWLNVCSSVSPPFPNTDQGCLWPFIFPSRNNCFLQCFCNTLKKFAECWEVQNRRQKSPQIPSFRENVFNILGHICIVFFFHFIKADIVYKDQIMTLLYYNYFLLLLTILWLTFLESLGSGVQWMNRALEHYCLNLNCQTIT